MKPVWLLLWAAAIGQVAIWTFESPAPPRADGRSQERALEPGQERAFGTNEDIHVQSRVGLRQQAFKALELPWGQRCEGDGRKKFVAGLSAYYYHRQNQTERYPENFGKAGADYIATQWSTGEDKRIDRLTQDAYARGYLRLADFDGFARKLLDAVVRDERVAGKACDG